MWSQFWRATQLVIPDYGECIVLWPNRMNANNHTASARPSLFSVQRLIKFSLCRTRRIVKFRSLSRLPKELTQVRGPWKRYVTVHQASNSNLLIFYIKGEFAPLRGQVSNMLLVSSAQSFIILRPVETRENIFILSRPFMCFENGCSPSSTSRVRFLGEIRILFPNFFVSFTWINFTSLICVLFLFYSFSHCILRHRQGK
jgi:hypothetical protein